MTTIKLIVLGMTALITISCATDDPHRRAKTGAAVGAIAGAVLGNQSSSKNGKYVGAAVGALTGAAVGNYMDKQQRKMEQQLAAERLNNEIRLTRIDAETLKLDVSSEVSFDINSANIRNDFRSSLKKVANVISEYSQTAVHVIGHTDSTGSTSYNQQLSEKRANSVGRYLSRSGVSRSRMRMSGRGENRPLADNSSSNGRSQNRRVEIYLKPIVKGRENDAFRAPL
jgi:outer membrane protein OmpA-like peptidoglycan-associated protein